MEYPLVSALMVTGMAGRLHMARQAVKCFLDQSYPNKELVIVNDGDYLVLPPELAGRHDILELRIPRTFATTLGDLRNLAMANAKGDWMIQWDDDDWYAPDRIHHQMLDCHLGIPSLLNYQVRYSFPNNSAFEIKWDGKIAGIPGTICFPKTGVTYRNEHRHEDSHFILDAFPETNVIDNTYAPALYVRFYHGANTWDHRHVMREYSEPKNKDRWDVSATTRLVLNTIIPRYNETCSS